jgi:DivIVA domain-containing protein
MVFLSALVVLVAGAVAALAVGRLGSEASVAMPEPVHTTGHDVLPPGRHGELTRADLAGVRFDRAVRGYRMDQVDAVLDRLAEEIATRDERLAALTTVGPGIDPDDVAGPGPAAHAAQPADAPREPNPTDPPGGDRAP